MFWTFGLSTQKINELQNMEGKMQSAILSKYPCTIFEYELEKNIQGKVGEQSGIFFDILKMEIICFNTGICFLTFNYKFRDINSNLSQLREYENIRIQTSTFKDIRDFSSLIKEIAGNSTGAKKINVDTDLRLAMTAGIRKEFAENPNVFDPRKYLGEARELIKETVKHKMVDVFGSANKA